jgi:chemotaxis protein methyltransferase CheR
MVEQVDPQAPALAALSLRRDDLAEIELQLFLDAILRYGGCDFRSFNQAVLRRRVAEAMRMLGADTISGLQDRLLHDERAFAWFVVSMRGTDRQLFADPATLHAFADHVVPYLRTYPFVRIWFAGAGIGAEVYSVAALLADAGMFERTLIYATCINDAAVATAKVARYEHAGEVQLEAVAREAGLKSRAASFFEIAAHDALPRDVLRDSVMFARHDPASDGSINEFVVIFARDLLPLYNGAVQYRLHRLFFESLGHLGFLVLGRDETLAGTVHEHAYQRVTPEYPIYRRMR